jgi:hypothetical protein
MLLTTQQLLATKPDDDPALTYLLLSAYHAEIASDDATTSANYVTTSANDAADSASVL